jgi:hypothetical protein
MQAVVDPLPLPTILQQTAATQLGQVAGNLGLADIQRTDQLADAELALTGDQQDRARPGVIGQALEENGGV